MIIEFISKAGMRKEDGILLTAYDGSHALIYMDEVAETIEMLEALRKAYDELA